MPLSALALVLPAAALHASRKLTARCAGGEHHLTFVTGVFAPVPWLPALAEG